MSPTFNSSLGIDQLSTTHKEEENGGLVWTSSPTRNIRVFRVEDMGGILAKHGKPWLKVCKTSPFPLLWNCFFLIFGGRQAYEHQHLIYLPLMDKCYTMGTCSRCLSEWEKPTGNMSGFFHHVKIIYITRGQNKLYFEMHNCHYHMGSGPLEVGGGFSLS